MSGQDLFDRILRALNGAVFDDALWPAASALIDELCDTKGNLLVFADGARDDENTVVFSRFCYRGERRDDWERDYFGTYYAVDERVPRLRSLPDGLLVPTTSLYTEEETRTSVVYNEALARFETFDGLNARFAGPGGSSIAFGLADPVGGNGWSPSRLEAAERVLPHLRQFVRVRQALVDAQALAASAMGVLDNDRVNVIQLDRRGRLAAANDRARALLNERDGLRDEDGYLRASMPAEDERLRGLIAQALPLLGGIGASGSMLVSRREPQPRLVLHVNPAREGGEGRRGTRLGALVLVDDPARTPIDPERMASALGLTRAESRIATLLAQGLSINAVAAAMRRSRTTIKWHLRQIYAKHGISRQTELARLVASAGDLTRPAR